MCIIAIQIFNILNLIFSIKRGDVEAQHSRIAKDVAERACRDSLNNVPEVRKGGMLFLDHQAKLWDGMLREIEKARSIGDVIQTKPDKAPNTSIQNVELIKGKVAKGNERK